MVKLSCPTFDCALNEDGAAERNLGLSGGGGCLRSCKGEVIFGFSYFYGVGTNMDAEARALLDGLRMAVKSGLPIAVIYSDSKALISMVHSRASPPRAIYKWWDELTTILNHTKWNLQHIYREGNTVADALASLACSTHSNKDFKCWKDLPPKAHGCATIDASGLPGWRM